jgi:hypothetical protein
MGAIRTALYASFSAVTSSVIGQPPAQPRAGAALYEPRGVPIAGRYAHAHGRTQSPQERIAHRLATRRKPPLHDRPSELGVRALFLGDRALKLLHRTRPALMRGAPRCFRRESFTQTSVEVALDHELA